MWCAKIQCKIRRKPNEMASNQNKTKDYQKPNQRFLIHTVYSYSHSKFDFFRWVRYNFVGFLSFLRLLFARSNTFIPSRHLGLKISAQTFQRTMTSHSDTWIAVGFTGISYWKSLNSINSLCFHQIKWVSVDFSWI